MSSPDSHMRAHLMTLLAVILTLQGTAPTTATHSPFSYESRNELARPLDNLHRWMPSGDLTPSEAILSPEPTVSPDRGNLTDVLLTNSTSATLSSTETDLEVLEKTQPLFTGTNLTDLLTYLSASLPKHPTLDAILDTDSGACMTVQQTLRRVYFNQVDLLRRGLPSPLVRAYMAKLLPNLNPFNSTACYPHSLATKYLTVHFHFRSALLHSGLPNISQVRSLNEQKYPFIAFADILKLPALTLDALSDAREKWDSTYSSILELKSQTRAGDIFVPDTISMLYDPNRTEVCEAYNKFGSLNSSHARDARTATIQLFTFAVKAAAMGASKSSLTQMLTHLSAYIFNGIRCTRMQGGNIMVPLPLMKAYAQNSARILANIAVLGTDIDATQEQILAAFEMEVDAMVSYNTLGNAYFHTVNHDRVYDIGLLATSLFSAEKLEALQMASPTTTSTGSSGNSTGSPPVCSSNYVYREDLSNGTNVGEKCCAQSCSALEMVEVNATDPVYATCCARCTQARCNDNTPVDFENLPMYNVIVPKLGQREGFLVPLMG